MVAASYSVDNFITLAATYGYFQPEEAMLLLELMESKEDKVYMYTTGIIQPLISKK